MKKQLFLLLLVFFAGNLSAVRGKAKRIAELQGQLGKKQNELDNLKSRVNAKLLDAVCYEEVAVVQALLDLGGDPEYKLNGRNLLLITLHEPVNEKKIAIACALLEMGANPEGTRSDSKTALYVAASLDMSPVVKKLLEKGADPLKKVCGTYPLHKAVQYGCTKSAMLLMQKTSANLLDNCGRTPLHCATGGMHFETGKAIYSSEMVEALLEHGENPELKDSIGKKPKDYADPKFIDGSVQIGALLDGWSGRPASK